MVILVLTSTLFTTGLSTLLMDLASIKVLFGATSALKGNIVQHCSSVMQHCARVVCYAPPTIEKINRDKGWCKSSSGKKPVVESDQKTWKNAAKIWKSMDWTISTAQKCPNVPVDTKHRFPIKFSDPERRCQHSPGAHCCRVARFSLIVFMEFMLFRCSKCSHLQNRINLTWMHHILNTNTDLPIIEFPNTAWEGGSIWKKTDYIWGYCTHCLSLHLKGRSKGMCPFVTTF